MIDQTELVEALRNELIIVYIRIKQQDKLIEQLMKESKEREFND